MQGSKDPSTKSLSVVEPFAKNDSSNPLEKTQKPTQVNSSLPPAVDGPPAIQIVSDPGSTALQNSVTITSGKATTTGAPQQSLEHSKSEMRLRNTSSQFQNLADRLLGSNGRKDEFAT